MILLELKSMRWEHLDLATGGGHLFEDVKSDILELTHVGEPDAQSGEQSQRLQDRLDTLVEKWRARRHIINVLQRLDFPEIRRRWDRISPTEDKTNEWIYDQGKTGFLDWLEHGRGIFWISGKVGAESAKFKEHGADWISQATTN